VIIFSRIPDLDRKRSRPSPFWPALMEIIRTEKYFAFCSYIFLISLFTAAVPCYNLGRLHNTIKHELPHCPVGLYRTWKEIIPLLKDHSSQQPNSKESKKEIVSAL